MKTCLCTDFIVQHDVKTSMYMINHKCGRYPEANI